MCLGPARQLDVTHARRVGQAGQLRAAERGHGILSAGHVQPEAAGQIQRLMILAIAFIEALCLYALLVAIMLIGKGKAAAHAEAGSEGVAPPAEASRH